MIQPKYITETEVSRITGRAFQPYETTDPEERAFLH